MKRIVNALASGLGTGYLPWVPGTWGTLPGLLLAYLAQDMSRWIFGGLWLIGIPLAAWICGQGAKSSHSSDPGWVVLDEVWGIMAVYLWAPAHHWSGWLVGFVLFRVFDILKPGPIRWAEENLVGGWAILLDDVLAGLFAGVLVQGAMIIGWIG